MNKRLFQYHPVVGYQFIPGLRARIEHEAGSYLVRVNNAGFRSEHEFVTEKQPGMFRILLFGDSFSAADGVSNKQRYSNKLEQLVPNTEVFNFALSGSGTDQQYLIYREFARVIECDLVVIAILVENIRRIVARYRPYQDDSGKVHVFAKPYYTLDANGELALHGVPVSPAPIPLDDLPASDRQHIDQGGRLRWLRHAVNQLGPSVKHTIQWVSGYQPVPAYDRADHPDWRLMRAILRRWITETLVPVILFPIPLYQHIEETASARGYQARFADLAAETGAIMHDPLRAFHVVPKSERRAFRYKLDVHPTPVCHEVLAESLAQAVRTIRAPDTTKEEVNLCR